MELVRGLWPNEVSKLTSHLRVLTHKRKQEDLLRSPRNTRVLVRTDFVRAWRQAAQAYKNAIVAAVLILVKRKRTKCPIASICGPLLA